MGTWHAMLRQQSPLAQKQRQIARELTEFVAVNAPADPATSDLPTEIARMLRDIYAHLLDMDLNVAAVRRRCALRNNNISTRFRCSMGIGVREYIEKTRIEAACRLLRRLDVEIYLVAMSVGYEHQETFCRAFNRLRGETPSEYRARSREWRG